MKNKFTRFASFLILFTSFGSAFCMSQYLIWSNVFVISLDVYGTVNNETKIYKIIVDNYDIVEDFFLRIASQCTTGRTELETKSQIFAKTGKFGLVLTAI